MTSTNDLLKRLLAGDFSPEEIAGDPVLVSLADRIYGIKIAPVNPVKPRDVQGLELPVAPVTEVAPPTDMLIEVIGDIAPAVPVVQDLNSLQPAEAGATSREKSKLLTLLSGTGFVVVVLNMFGVLSTALGSMCSADDLCPSDGYTRINLLDFYKIDTGYGWSEPIQTGTYGIPDIVAIVATGLLLFLSLRK
tara:strand:- start:2043 stop:2618 length:576 start_codon:yes stop_codon:yes gene_type:complete